MYPHSQAWESFPSTWYFHQMIEQSKQDNTEQIYYDLSHAENKIVSKSLQIHQLIGAEPLPDWSYGYTGFDGAAPVKNAIFEHLVDTVLLDDGNMCDSLPYCPQDVLVSTGVANSIEYLCSVFCDRGEGVMICSPMYNGFPLFIEVKPELVVCPAMLDKANGYKITRKVLQQGLDDANDKGVQVKLLIVVTPHNPTGTIRSRKELQTAVDFCKEHDLQLVSNEIYANCVVGTHNQFTSMASLVAENPNDLFYQDNVHILWGISKEFGLSSLRMGVTLTRSQLVKNRCGATGVFYWCSLLVQVAIERLLSDRDRVTNILTKFRVNLGKYTDLALELADEYGLLMNHPKGSLFFLMDLRECLKKLAELNNLEISFDVERLLFKMILDEGVILLPGESFYMEEPGYFRVCCTVLDDPLKDLPTVFERIHVVTTQLANK
eukprot:TRINITY_DN11131_c0_g1_i1.p1 TRINITY_DN11131_c0_g1~~TRINITY_DN11131_c0_g1_i1.p1  ORF type:complete len:435 (+),score=62.58 TRINITY_DN11131_c0_g1_i1:290-1594(+)